jgi:hypothetical protein
MNVTRDLITDLLPVYFSGEASEDTRRVVEVYFRENPEFERIARKAATPLKDLRAAAPFTDRSAAEKRDWENIRYALRVRKWLFGFGLLFTLLPLYPFFDGHVIWPPLHGDAWGAVSFWSLAGLMWLLYFYFARRGRGTSALVAAVFLAVVWPLINVRFFSMGGPRVRHGLPLVAINWFFAALALSVYFNLRRRYRQPGNDENDRPLRL